MLINVIIVDDHPLVRAGIKRLLADVTDIVVIGEADSGEDAVLLVREKRPHVVLMDVRMPGIGGLEATRRMLHNSPGVKIVALTTCIEEPYPTKLLQAGASGYLTKEASLEEMIGAIRTVHAGKKYIGSQVAQQLALKGLQDKESLICSLSDRELQIMLMLTQGQKVKTISDALCLSPKTVNSYKYRIFEKLGVEGDVEMTRIAIAHGFLDAEIT